MKNVTKVIKDLRRYDHWTISSLRYQMPQFLILMDCQNHILIFRCKGPFVLKQNNDNVTIKRDHFPIVPAFSCTAHKSQEQTLKKIIIDLVSPKGMKSIDTSFAYVPLSRVRTLQDLNMLQPFSSNVLTMGMNTDCSEMMKDFEQRDLCKNI